MAYNYNSRRSFANPAINRVNNFDDAYGMAEAATYRGVFMKIAYFLGVTLLGVGAFFYMHHYFAVNGYAGVHYEGYTIYNNEAAILMGAWIVTLVAGLVAAFAIRTIPVTGTIYCAGMGYSLSLTSYLYAAQYRGIVVVALVLTVLIIAAMAFLYLKKIVRVGERFRTIVLTALLASFLGSLFFILVRFLAPNSAIVSAITKIQNGPLGILLAFLGVVLGACLLLVDFEVIVEAVEHGVNARYEWYCSYSLMLSVIYIYIRVLELLVRIQNAKK